MSESLKLADEIAIRDLVNRHSDATSRLDPVGVADNFTADGEWVSATVGQARGRDDLCVFFAGLLEGWDLLVQGLLAGLVDLDLTDPDRATGRWYIREFGQRSDGSEFESSGVYHDLYVRDGERWRFARRRYESLLKRVGDDVTISKYPSDGSGGD